MIIYSAGVIGFEVDLVHKPTPLYGLRMFNDRSSHAENSTQSGTTSWKKSCIFSYKSDLIGRWSGWEHGQMHPVGNEQYEQSHVYIYIITGLSPIASN